MDKKRTVLHFILQYIGITIASIMYAMALAWFLNPNQLAPGGVSGIAIVLKEIFPFLPGIGALILIFNIPILLLGVWKFGVKFTISTIYTVVFSSIVIDLIPSITGIKAITMDPMLAAVIGGALHGIAIGILFRALKLQQAELTLLLKLSDRRNLILKQVSFILFWTL